MDHKTADDPLQESLEQRLNLESPWERLIAAMSVAKPSSQELLIPYPPHAARQVSGLQVRDTSRGERHVWTARFPWEADVWLETLLNTCPTTASPVRVLGYLSEPPEIRRQLALKAREQLRQRGVQAQVTLRSSYKPGYFWLLEEVLPVLRRHGADRLAVRFPVVPNTFAGRFLQELYPVSALLEPECISFEASALEQETALYQASGFAGQREVWNGSCLAPQSVRTRLNQTVLSPTGWLELHTDESLKQQQISTDGERFWLWYENEVLPQILTLSPSEGPFFQRLTVSAKLSEPDLSLNLEPERISMLEALAEEVYFSTLETYQQRANVPLGDRGLKVGQIIPIFSEALGQAGQARVSLTLVGDGQVGARDPNGTVRLATGQIGAQSAMLNVSGVPKRFEHDQTFAKAGVMPTWDSVWRSKHHADQPGAQKPSSLPKGPLSAQDIWRETDRLGQLPNASSSLIGYSVQGRPIVMLHQAFNAMLPTLLVTAGQHANEPTGPRAALELIEQCWSAGRQINVVGIPLKNPDGLRLYHALRQLHPEHMHHPARYTALGVDLEATTSHEAAALQMALSKYQPRVHLNLHGYPAHEWTRPYSGYAPQGFESWAVPMGAMVIVVHDSRQKALAHELAAIIAKDLVTDHEIFQVTQKALRQRAAHVLKDPFELVEGMPFIFWERDARSVASPSAANLEERGTITVITEMPDETIYGQRFDLGVRTQVLIGQSLARWVELEV